MNWQYTAGTACLREIYCNISITIVGEECSVWWVQPGTSVLQHTGNCSTRIGTVAALQNSPVIFSL